MTYREKKICILVALSCSIFGVFFVGGRLFQSVNLNQFLGNAAALAFLVFGGWAAVAAVKNANADRQARRFRDSYDLRHTAGGAVIISDNPSVYAAFIPNRSGVGGAGYIPTQQMQQHHQTQQLQPLMPLIKHELSVGVIGAQGTGKTTFFTNVLCERLNDNETVYIVDPHCHAGKYPDGIQQIGKGRNYQEIDQFLQWALNEMNERYRRYPAALDALTIGVDELTLLHSKCNYIADFMESALTEFRKVNMKLVFCCHSRRAKYLNLKGGYDLTDGIIFVDLHNSDGNRYAEITKNGTTEQKKYSLPGPYQQIEYHGHESRGHTSDHDGHGVTDHEQKIIDMHLAGYSLSRISREIYGIKNGKTVDKIKAVLRNKIDRV